VISSVAGGVVVIGSVGVVGVNVVVVNVRFVVICYRCIWCTDVAVYNVVCGFVRNDGVVVTDICAWCYL